MPQYRCESPDGTSLIELAIHEGDLVVKQRTPTGGSLLLGLIRALLAINGRIPLDEVREFFVREDIDGVHRLYMMFGGKLGMRCMKAVVLPGEELTSFLDVLAGRAPTGADARDPDSPRKNELGPHTEDSPWWLWAIVVAGLGTLIALAAK